MVLSIIFSKLNRKIYLLSLVALVLFILIGIFIYTKANSVSTPLKVMTSYLNAMENQQASQAATYVIDKRFPSQSALASFYKSDYQFERITGYKIKPKQISTNTAQVEVFAQMNNGQNIDQTFTLVKQSEKWFIFIESYKTQSKT
jgi:hypothetical protein